MADEAKDQGDQGQAKQPPTQDPNAGAGAGNAGKQNSPGESPPPEGEGSDKGAGQAGAKDEGKESGGEGKDPVTYDLKLSQDSSLDSGMIKEVEQFAEKNGLDQPQAQAVLDLQQETVAQFKESQSETFEQEKGQWLQEAKSDKEIGGELFNHKVGLSNKLIKSHGSEELQKILENTGALQHRAFIRFFSNIQEDAFEESKFKKGVPPAGKEKSIAEHMFGEGSVVPKNALT